MRERPAQGTRVEYLNAMAEPPSLTPILFIESFRAQSR